MKGSDAVRTSPWLLVIAGGVIMGAALGIRHVQGLFLQPITLDLNWPRETFAVTLAAQNLIWGLTQPFVGMIADRYGSARVLFVGALIYACGLAVMANSASALGFMLGNGVMIGIGLSGTAFGAVYGALSRIFPAEHRSWALGAAGAVGGLGQFLMVPLAQGAISEAGWIWALLVLCGLMLVIAPFSGILRDDPTQQKAGPGDQTMGAAIVEAVSHRGFWLLNLGFLACGFQLAFLAGHMPSYLIDKGLTARDGSIALAIITLANVIGTYFCGYLGGFLRRKYMLSALYLTRAAAIAIFVLTPLSQISVYVFSFVMGLLWLGTVPLTNGIVSQIFGTRYITTLFGIVFFGHQIGAFLGLWLAGYAFDVTKSYDLVWFASVALGVIAAALHAPINDRSIVRTPQLASQPA